MGTTGAMLELLAHAETATVGSSGAALVSHVLHLLAGMTLVGGLIWLRFVLVPATRGLPPEEAERLHAAARSRWSKLTALAVAFLLGSGLYSFAQVTATYRVPSYYQGLFGGKFLLAFFIFFVASLLGGRSEGAVRFRERMTLWLNLSLIAAVAVVVMGSVLVASPKEPKPPRESAPSAQSEPLDG